MKRLLVVLSLTMVLSTPSFASVVEHTYVFESPRIVAIGDYDLITFEGTFPAGKLGGPTLPFKDVELLLPPGEAVVRVEIEKQDPVTVDAPLHLFPQQPVRPISSGPGALP